MRRRDLLKGALPAATLIQGWLQTPLPPPSAPGELLYNGIRLPAEWPPRLPQGIDTAEPAPYVVHPPKVIPVDVGRQLFVDDFLIEENAGVIHVLNAPSPAATASIVIGRHVAARAVDRFAL